MSKEYDNTNTGVLFLNDRKESDKHPDRKGSIDIEGKQYWLSGWDKQTSKGETVSLKATPKDDAKAVASKAKESANTARGNDSFDDDVGF